MIIKHSVPGRNLWPLGIEPTTLKWLIWCSTYWAKQKGLQCLIPNFSQFSWQSHDTIKFIQCWSIEVFYGQNPFVNNYILDNYTIIAILLINKKLIVYFSRKLHHPCNALSLRFAPRAVHLISPNQATSIISKSQFLAI